MEMITKEMMSQANDYIDQHFPTFKDRETMPRQFEMFNGKLYVNCETRSEYRTFKFYVNGDVFAYVDYEGDWKSN